MQDHKKQLRILLRGRRRDLSAAAVTEKSGSIAERLRGFAPLQHAHTLVLYNADENEVTTEALWQEAAAQGKAIYYPRIAADLADLEFVRRYPGDRLIPGTFDILIPPGNDLLNELQLTDIVFTPGVGFDPQGGRLGRGRGYYDRAFRGVLARALRVALAYDFQLVPSIPIGPSDEKVHYIITESQIINCLVKNIKQI